MRQSQRFELERQLSERDKAVIETLAAFRLAATQHLKTLHFSDVSQQVCDRALGRLRRLGVVSALSWHPNESDLRVRNRVYQLGQVGRAYTDTGQQQVRRPTEYGAYFIAHTLAITNVYIELFGSPIAELMFVTEPRCWRGALKPDAYIRLIAGGYRRYWFIEVDLATERPNRIKKKLDAYMRYHQSGQEQQQYKIFPKVLFVVPNDERKTQIQKLIDRHPARKLFRVALHQNSLTALTGGPSL